MIALFGWLCLGLGSSFTSLPKVASKRGNFACLKISDAAEISGKGINSTLDGRNATPVQVQEPPFPIQSEMI